jgi:hypothetical protein
MLDDHASLEDWTELLANNIGRFQVDKTVACSQFKMLRKALSMILVAMLARGQPQLKNIKITWMMLETNL